MPRRRMIDPFFYTDPKVGKLSRDERGLIVGCVCQSDDEGRLQGDPAFLKSEIFKYDNDLDNATIQKLRDACLKKMQSWPATHPYRMFLYSSSEEEYICFPNWSATNRPSHPTKSQLPPSPPEALPIFSRVPQEEVPKESRDPPPQVSQVKVSIGQSSAVREDFTKFLDNKSDLTDFLRKTLTLHMSSAGEQLTPQKAAQLGMPVLAAFWEQVVGTKLAGVLWQGAYDALQKYPVEWIAIAFVKAGPYQGGKHKSWKYFQAIIDEEMKKHPPAARSP